MQHDSEGLVFQLGIWGFCCTVGTTGPNCVGMDETSLLRDSSEHVPRVYSMPGPGSGTGETHRSLEEMQSLLHCDYSLLGETGSKQTSTSVIACYDK